MNGQHRPNKATQAEQDAQIFRLKLQGLTVRQIATAVSLPKSTVDDRISKAIAELVNPLAEEARAIERARLDALRIEANAVLSKARADDDHELRLKAIDRLLRVSERAAKLDGLDASKPMEITLSARIDVESSVVSETLVATLAAVLDALPSDADGTFRARLHGYALEVAQHALISAAGEDPGPPPEAPRPLLAIMPGSPSTGPADDPLPDGPTEPGEDAADAVLRELEATMAEFPDLDWGDDS